MRVVVVLFASKSEAWIEQNKPLVIGRPVIYEPLSLPSSIVAPASARSGVTTHLYDGYGKLKRGLCVTLARLRELEVL